MIKVCIKKNGSVGFTTIDDIHTYTEIPVNTEDLLRFLSKKSQPKFTSNKTAGVVNES